MPKLKVTAQPKTVRFAALVKESGPPEVSTLWDAPENDKNFMAAVREGRVVTVKQENVGTRKDYGTVGYLKGKNVTYLLFPKKLRHPADMKVIGIKYDLVAEPALVKRRGTPADLEGKERRTKLARARTTPTAERGLPRNDRKAASSREKVSPPKSPPPPPPKWKVHLHLTVELNVTNEVEATSARAAKEKAVRAFDAASVDWSKGKIKKKATAARNAG